MTRDPKSVIVFTYRGDIERGAGGGRYVWKRGYSETLGEGRIAYPWMTMVECRAVAKSRGATAVFEKERKS